MFYGKEKGGKEGGEGGTKKRRGDNLGRGNNLGGGDTGEGE